ncbi:MAG TPA: hypothetical protein VK273_07840 [Gaiellaceae bacterium]|nr:hypothetical protein [Gaiellaceae bacterium]
MRFAEVRLAASAGRLRDLAGFYGGELGIDVGMSGADRLSFAIGETAIEFVAGSGEPFYHVALLVPCNRFDEALEWAGARTELLPDRESGDVLFDFDNWTAHACYFLDPADNIVELIAHHGTDETEEEGVFSPGNSSVCLSSGWSEIPLYWPDSWQRNLGSPCGTEQSRSRDSWRSSATGANVHPRAAGTCLASDGAGC